MLIMFIKRFEILGYWRLGCCEVLLLLLLLFFSGVCVCATLYYKSTGNLAITWRLYYSQDLVYIAVQVQVFCLHFFPLMFQSELMS